MLKFDRRTEPPPATLSSERVARTRLELLRYFSLDPDERTQTRVPKPDVDMHDPSIMAALNRLFRGKCAFCETRENVNAYLFRPASNASPLGRTPANGLDADAQLYYAWLGSAWENFFPICSECQPYEVSYFPVHGDRCPLPTIEQLERFADEGTGLWRDYPLKEKSCLIDPTDLNVRLWAHLQPSFSGSLWELSRDGRDTIEFFNLNSGDIIQRRSFAYNDLMQKILNVGSRGSRDPIFRGCFDFKELEFGGTWYLLLRRVAATFLENGRGGGMPSTKEMASFFARLVRNPSAREHLQAAIVSLKDGGDVPAAPVRRRKQARPPKGSGLLELRGFLLQDFKGIERLAIDLPKPMFPRATRTWTAHAPSMLLLGENAVGKTSVLEALALALSDGSDRMLAPEPARLILDPSQLGSTAQVPGTARIELEFDDGYAGLAISRHGFEDDEEHARLQAKMPRVFAYGAFRQYGSQKGNPATSHVQNLFRSETLLPNPEKWLLKLPDRQFEEVARALRIIIAGEASYGHIERDMQVEKCFLTSTVERSGHPVVRARTPIDSVSSGFRSMLAMTCDIFEGLLRDVGHGEVEILEQARAVVLIDEIEAHLHPRWKMRVMAGLREALPRVTFIATTHDPLCLRGMEDGEVRVLQHAHSSTGAHPTVVEVLKTLPSASTMTVEQLLTSDLFQLISTDSADLDLALAKMADERVGLARSPLTEHEREMIRAHQRDVENALPIGSSMAHQMVQEAVAEFLRKRASRSFEQRSALREATKKRILSALGESFDETR